MANQEQVKFLRGDIQAWNLYRKNNPSIYVDLINADLSEAFLNRADLSDARLIEADLTNAELIGSQLRNASFVKANLQNTNLHNATLKEADLTRARLVNSNFSESDLSFSKLHGAHFRRTNLSGTILAGASVGNTTFEAIDLSEVKGIQDVEHFSSSHIDTLTLLFSKGRIPKEFLKGCGLSNWEIEWSKLYDPDLSGNEIDEILYQVHNFRAHQPIQISPLFISYSHADSNFVDRMEKALDEKGIRFWRDIYDMKAGRIEKQLGHAISHNTKVLLILSKNSIQSDWVQHEARLARKLELDTAQDILCPIRLDDSFFTSSWPERIKEQVMEYNIINFSEWKDNEKFEKMFTRLIDGLNMFYKKEDK